MLENWGWGPWTTTIRIDRLLRLLHDMPCSSSRSFAKPTTRSNNLNVLGQSRRTASPTLPNRVYLKQALKRRVACEHHKPTTRKPLSYSEQPTKWRSRSCGVGEKSLVMLTIRLARSWRDSNRFSMRWKRHKLNPICHLRWSTGIPLAKRGPKNGNNPAPRWPSRMFSRMTITHGDRAPYRTRPAWCYLARWHQSTFLLLEITRQPFSKAFRSSRLRALEAKDNKGLGHDDVLVSWNNAIPLFRFFSSSLSILSQLLLLCHPPLRTFVSGSNTLKVMDDALKHSKVSHLCSFASGVTRLRDIHGFAEAWLACFCFYQLLAKKKLRKVQVVAWLLGCDKESHEAKCKPS